MNKSIITLISVIFLIMANNNFINANHDNTTINKLINKSIINENTTSLINNQYGYLSKSDWITHQSITDNRFYSYDTSALKDYTFSNARNTF